MVEMNPRTVLTVADGRNIDLQNPQASDFHNPAWAAEHLAKENRYNGATPGVIYSVAQHTCEGVFAIMNASADRTLAAYFSLHDFHESLFKDDTTPKKRSFAATAEQRFGVLASAILEIFDEQTDRVDAAVHSAAGLQWPPPSEIAAEVKRFDRIMLVTEWRDLMGDVPLPNAEAYADVKPLRRKIKPLKRWQRAHENLLLTWNEFVPNLFDF